MVHLVAKKDGVLLPVKVVPGASRTRLMGEWNGRIRIAVAAPPERGQANQALLAFLAARLGIRRSAVAIVDGHAGPQKTIRIEGVGATTVLAALQPDRS